MKLGAASPYTLLAGIIVLQLGLWTAIPLLGYAAPPLDVVELYSVSSHWQIANYKHPNLPGLLLQAGWWITGGGYWSHFLIAQLCVALTYIFVHQLGRDLVGERRAIAGVLLLTGVFYFSWPTPELNHNVVQMPLWALLALALWRAIETDRRIWWLVLGAAGGLSLWAKFLSGVMLLLCLVWLISDRKGRERLQSSGPWLALVVFLIVVTPQIHSLVASDFLPIKYAAQRSAHASGGHWSWIGFSAAQLASHAIMFLMAATAGLFGRGARSTESSVHYARPLMFLLLLGGGPLVLMSVLSLLFGIGLRDMWGAPMFNLSGLLLLAWLPGRFTERAHSRLFKMAVMLIVVVSVGYGGDVLLRPQNADKPKRANWPQRDIATFFDSTFRRETGHALQIIVGPYWQAGLIALRSGSRPDVVIDADFKKSPWVTPTRLDRDGYLVVWDATREPPPAVLSFLAKRGLSPDAAKTHGFAWSPRPTAKTIRYDYIVVPPRAAD